MTACFRAAVLLLVAVAAHGAADMSAGGISLAAHGQGGGFQAYRTEVGESDPNKVVVLMDAVREVDVHGHEVGTSGAPGHSVQTFKARQFTVSLPDEKDIGTVEASRVSFTSPIGSVGQLKIDNVFFTKAGAVGPEGDTWEASAGDLQWDIELSAWSWCGCEKDDGTDEVGAFIDVLILVKGNSSAPTQAASSRGKAYDLGGGVTMELTSKLTVDGGEAVMPAGYPRLEARDSAQVLVLRFPKFKHAAVYSPVLRTSGAMVTTTVTTTTTSTVPLVARNDAGGTSIEVQAKGGRLAAYSTAAGDSDPHKVVVRIEAVRELDIRGKVVGPASGKAHVLQSFAAQEFAIGVPQPVSLGTARASKVSFSSAVGSVGQLKVDTFILTKAGTVGSSGQMWLAEVGDVKWNIVLSSWSWCGCLSRGVQQKGAFIDVDIAMLGSNGHATKTADGEHTYDLGGGVLVELSNVVEVDSENTPMPAGYPRLEMRGTTQVFVLRFPRFQRSAVYDPLVRMSGSESYVTVGSTMFISHADGLAAGYLVFVALLGGVMLTAGLL